MDVHPKLFDRKKTLIRKPLVSQNLLYLSKAIVKKLGTTTSFFNAQTEASNLKATMVAKYFSAWVNVENNEYSFRINDLKEANASIKFLSIEPLLGPIPNLDLKGIDWVIVGGESGPKSRIICRDWVIDIRDQCTNAAAPFFFKQWGGVNKKKAGRLLEGRHWCEWPAKFAARIPVKTQSQLALT